MTRKEFDLLARLARNAGRVVSRENLMCDVWDENWFGSTKTLDVHVSGLRRKLGEDPGRAGQIQTVRGVGFRLSNEGRLDRPRRTFAPASRWRSPTSSCSQSWRSACRSRSA